MAPATIALGLDAEYLVGAACLLRSIGAHLSSKRYRVIILGNDLTSKDQEFLTKAAEAVGLIVEFRPVKLDLSGLPTGPSLSAAIYYRLALQEACPDLSTVLYLDADTIVLRNLNELLCFDLGDAPLAAVQDLNLPVIGLSLWDFEIAGFGPDAPYFNAGVMLLNLSVWREERIADRALAVLRRHPRLRLADQDALNIILVGRWLPLDRRWNVFPMLELLGLTGYTYFGDQVVPRSALSTLQDDAWIMHYASFPKPWQPGFPPGRNLERFRRYLHPPE